MIKHTLIALLLTLGLTGAVMAEDSVDINSASVEQLAESLNGVGEAKARAIVAYRESNGPFTHMDELVNVRGIGLATVERNRDRIKLSQSE